ncbi:hypothetical protein [Mucilaginibacter pocheonensis]|uniref:Uncharacterized protein n=1 Tax=Mucilaginibacter pocheonensis TaxID=398050 RepID=A0ABU1T957_9SPHI|nr:hypothetical protein [Mucilaginibacter pocheonensis]MDR6941386.1 hypothetical protein [Mucilaginibacter pocheonensis]
MNGKDPSAIQLDHYQVFELTDKHVMAYNEWVASGPVSADGLHQWLEIYATEAAKFEAAYGTDFLPKVVLWSDRQKTDYFKEKLQVSLGFENYIEKLVKEQYGLDLGPYLTPEGQYDDGENELGIEIKNDTLIKKTGNIYLEYGEKSHGGNLNFIESGILKNDKSIYFLIGDTDAFYIFKKARLVTIYREEIAINRSGKRSERGIRFVRIATSLGMLFPVKFAQAEMLTMDQMIAEIKAGTKDKE